MYNMGFFHIKVVEVKMSENLYNVVSWEWFKWNLKENYDIAFRTIDDIFINEPKLYKWDDLDNTDVFTCLSI